MNAHTRCVPVPAVNRYCEPCLERKAGMYRAVVIVDDTPMCKVCLSGGKRRRNK
jgi:hypothetical protein